MGSATETTLLRNTSIPLLSYGWTTTTRYSSLSLTNRFFMDGFFSKYARISSTSAWVKSRSNWRSSTSMNPSTLSIRIVLGILITFSTRSTDSNFSVKSQRVANASGRKIDFPLLPKAIKIISVLPNSS